MQLKRHWESGMCPFEWITWHFRFVFTSCVWCVYVCVCILHSCLFRDFLFGTFFSTIYLDLHFLAQHLTRTRENTWAASASASASGCGHGSRFKRGNLMDRSSSQHAKPTYVFITQLPLGSSKYWGINLYVEY